MPFLHEVLEHNAQFVLERQRPITASPAKKIAIFNVEGAFYAIDDTCTHRGGPLSEGTLDGKQVTCPWHGGVFDVATGEVSGPPPLQGVSRYNVRIAGGDVEVEV